MWKKLCNDKKYSKICHYEDEIMNRVEMSLKHSKNNEKDDEKNSEKDDNDGDSEIEITPKIIVQSNSDSNNNVPIVPSNSNNPMEKLSINTSNINNKINNYYNISSNQVEYNQISYIPTPVPNKSIISTPSSSTECQQITYYPTPITNESLLSSSSSSNEYPPLSYYPTPIPNESIISSTVSSSNNTPPLSYYPTPVQNKSIILPSSSSPNENVQYSISPSPIICKSNSFSPDQLTITNQPVYEVQYQSSPINTQCSKLFSNYQKQSNEIIYYY